MTPPKQVIFWFRSNNFIGNWGGVAGPIFVGWAAGAGPGASGFNVVGFTLQACALLKSILRAWTMRKLQ